MRRSRLLLPVTLAFLVLTALLVPTSSGAGGPGDTGGPGTGDRLEKPRQLPSRSTLVEGDGIVVNLDGDAPQGSTRAAPGGYALFDGSVGLAGSYTVRMVNDRPWSSIDEEVAAVMDEVEYASGARFTMGPTAPSHFVTGYDEIGVSVSTNSPCGRLYIYGVIGCGVSYQQDGRIVNGEVYICGCIAGGSQAFAVVLHEFGHTLNLAHYSSNFEGQRQVMYPIYQDGITRLRSGDVNGLRKVAALGFGGGTAVTHPPGPTGKPSVSNGGIGLLDTSWTAAAAFGKPIDRHQVQVENTATDATKTETFGSSRSAEVPVAGGDNYRARVRAHNSKGWGPWSSWSSSRYVTGRCLPDIDDVPDHSDFCDDISWLLTNDIANGFSNDTFRPTDDVSRQAMAAFLMRDAERLVPGSTDGDWSASNSFSDVAPDDPFHDEIEWLASTGITTGFPNGTFKPLDDINRMSMAAMLMRFTEHLYPGSTAGDWSASPFSDVPPSKPFHDEITWLASTGITTGFPNGTYRPDADVTREAMAAFLHRHDTEFG